MANTEVPGAEDPVTVEQRGRVLLATMDDGRANAMSVTMSGALRAALTRAEADPGIGAMVIAGRPGRFSGGFDLNVIRGGDAAAVREMVNGGGALVAEAYGASVPVVAACTGHAVAAGALLLLGCDHRVGPDAEVKVGLNEVAIGLTLPRWALAIAAERLSRRHLQASVANAQLYDGAGAVAAGFLDTAVEPDVVIEAAMDHAAVLAELDPAAYAATVQALRGPTLAAMAR
ncbi:MAG: crotonase/enoyl-CoA hydratase family protein [Acidimicrobiales bacterium]